MILVISITAFMRTLTQNEMVVTVFSDSNHGHDKVTGRSVTGLIAFVGLTPKRQTSVQTSAFDAKFMAAWKAVEEVVAL